MRRVLALLSVMTFVVLGGALAAKASADDGEARLTFSLKAGAFFPVHGTMRSETASEWWYLGVDLDPGFRYKPANGTVHFGVDFDFRQAQGRGVFTIPLTAKVLWPIAPLGDSGHFYGGLGPGVYIMNSRHSGQVIKPGLQFVAGMDLGSHVYLEAAYDWVGAFYDDRNTPLRADAVKVALGVRF